MILFAVAITGISTLVYGELKHKKERDKLAQLKTEMKTIEKLVKKAQKDRFINKTLAPAIYNIRIEQYRKRLERLKGEIPAQEKLIKRQGAKKKHKWFK